MNDPNIITYNEFQKFEEEYKLYRYSWWECLRPYVYCEFSKKINNFEAFHPLLETPNIFHKIKRKINSIASLIYDRHKIVSKVPLNDLIIDHIRIKQTFPLYNYSSYITNITNEFDFVVNQVGPTSNYSLWTLFRVFCCPSRLNSFYWLYVKQFIVFIFYRFFYKFTDLRHENCDLIFLCKKIYPLYKTKELFYINYLKWIKPKNVKVVVYYFRQYIIAAAKKLNIPTYEIQHGVLNKFHYGYNFKNFSPQLFPDYMYVWGKHWKGFLETTKINASFLEFQRDFDRTLPLVKDYFQKTILVISQPIIAKQLQALVNKILIELPEAYNVVWRFHPEDIQDISGFQDFSRISVSKKSLAEDFASCGHVIGVSSTALIEAVFYNKLVYVAKLPSYKYMDDFMGYDNVQYLSSKVIIESQLKENSQGQHLF